MNESIIDSFITELRNEGIPPYCKNETLKQYLYQANGALERYVEDIDYTNDFTARDLIKNYVWYAFNKMSNEFFVNYGDTLVSWQISKVQVGDIDDSYAGV